MHIPGQKVKFGLLLWSSSPIALEELSNPECIDAVFMSSDMFGTDVLRPRNAARKNRTRVRLSQGRVWKSEAGPPADDKMPVLRSAPGAGRALEKERGRELHEKARSPVEKKKPTSRLQQSFTATVEGSSDDLECSNEKMDPEGVNEESGIAEDNQRPSSPASSLEDIEDTEPDGEQVVRLDGDVLVANSMPPSFRYEFMGWVVSYSNFL